MASLLTASAFLLLLAAGVLLQRLPVGLLWLYGGASVLAVALYAIDKRAAMAGRPRIAERTLHGVALAGGWPGALAAQSLLRHKTAKRAFRRIWWLTVAANCAALAAWWWRCTA